VRQFARLNRVDHCHLGLGRLYGRTGQARRATGQRATATATYREMDMRFWLAQAATETI
jgi:hypothetical protein